MSHRLQVLIPESLQARVRKSAVRRRLSESAWVRQVIEKALANPGDAVDPIAKLARLSAPTGNIKQMLAEIEAGRR